MDQLESKLDAAEASHQGAPGMAPTDGPGNPAYRRMKALLAQVQAQEAARRN